MDEDRRNFLRSAAALALSACAGPQAPTPRAQPRPSSTASIALLHLAPEDGAVEQNRNALMHAVQVAAQAGANLVMTPELSVSGYAFADLIGTDWIAPQPDPWLRELQGLVAKLGPTVLVGLPERDAKTGHLHNSLIAIGPDGAILGRHRKIRTLKVGSEAWSSPGTDVESVTLPWFGEVGMFICADAVDASTALSLKEQGAKVLVSAANWAPGPYGPDGEWERCSALTSLPVIVCNRTGVGRTLDFRQAESAVVCGGTRKLSLSSAEPVVFLIRWDREAEEPLDYARLSL
ncbi:MAG: carbon-nitrogen hydrolase family protein [Myxococcota bacterium]